MRVNNAAIKKKEYFRKRRKKASSGKKFGGNKSPKKRTWKRGQGKTYSIKIMSVPVKKKLSDPIWKRKNSKG